MLVLNALYFLLALFAQASAQTVSVPDGLGDTIVEVITINNLGVPTTVILATLPATSAAALSSSSSTAVAAVPPGQQGPVPQPDGTTAADPDGPTPYTFTTTDANGDPIVATSVFVPSFPTGAPAVIPATGTVLDYSAWLSLVGTNTQIGYGVGAKATSSAATPVAIGPGVYSVLCAVLVSLASGAAVVLAW